MTRVYWEACQQYGDRDRGQYTKWPFLDWSSVATERNKDKKLTTYGVFE